MKYNTISTSSLDGEGKKASFTIYADMDISHNKMATTESEITAIRSELEIVQKALRVQTKRCRQLVAEYTRRLQQKEQQYQSEKALRDDQLAKVLRALIIFEARLKQEQKYISHQLKEKDYIIRKQSNEIKKLLSNQYCKNCNQYYNSPSSPNLESLDSSSEYVVTDYQSSNFESLDSSSDIYATISEKSFTTDKQSGEETSKTDTESTKNIYQKNKGKDSIGRRAKKFQHRKSVGTYFEVLKLRNDNISPCSNEDNTSNDYDHLDSLPPESITEKIHQVSDRIESILLQEENGKENDSSSNLTVSECNNTVIDKLQNETKEELVHNLNRDKPASDIETKNNILNESFEPKTKKSEKKLSKITDSIPVFEGDGETNDNWYASASDQEDEEQRDIYRNNPVLECMNQILLQNINDSMNSPPKTPNVERKSLKSKKVKFSDEEDNKQQPLTKENVRENTQENTAHDYYETPIQKIPNFYETPQSIYSNDYEQILSKCSETFSNTSSNKVENMQEKEINRMAFKKLSVPKNSHFDNTESKNHFYVDLDSKSESEDKDGIPARRLKILRTPPALPPKPANLVMKYRKTSSTDSIEVAESEPDYCSISELNLPPTKNVSFKTINVVAEINPTNSQDVKSKLEKATKISTDSDYDPVVVNDNIPNLVVKKCVEKLNIQLAKQTPTIKADVAAKKHEPEIPKLPQVSEIIIPDEDVEQQEERISHDNYVKNNSQILKLKKFDRRPIVMGTSVSTLITGFNNQQLISEISKKPERNKLDKRVFSSFENLQNLDKPGNKKETTETFDNFDLSQNFEEFKLDDCEIEEYNVNDIPDMNEEEITNEQIMDEAQNTRVELIRATNDPLVPNLNVNSVEMLKRQLEMQKSKVHGEQLLKDGQSKKNVEPTYEHFLECTGLSSKSILTPSRLLSNHKSMLKPKDIKLRSKVKANNNLFERHSTSTIKYWSEPYL